MKVLHVASWYPADESDIAGVFIREHVRCLAPHVDQHLVAPSEEAEVRYEERGFTVARPRLHYRRGSWLVPYVRQVTREARRFGPDLLHGHVTRPAGVAARWAARATGVPYVLTEHTAPFSALFATHALNRAAARWALRGASAVTAVTRHHAAEISARVAGVRPVVVPNVVDTARFAPRTAAADGGCRLLFIGRLVPQKGCDLLLDALASPALSARGWSLTIVGGGPDEGTIRARAAALGPRVRLVGAQPPASVPQWLAEADVLVLPSRFESFGVVLIEALAAGVPVLATRCGGPEDVVDDEVGRLVPAEDVGGLAAGIAWMIDHASSFRPEALRSCAERRFGFSAVARRFLDVYRAALAGRPARDGE